MTELMITIAPSKDHFIRNGKKTFILADTVWTGLSNASETEWDAYLDYRRMQNYNALQLSVLQQWDGGAPDSGLYPFALKENGFFDYNRLNAEYFSRALKLLTKAVETGFIPMLIILHASYTAGTWAVKDRPEAVMPLDVVKSYSEYAANMFKHLNPIYIVAGDTNFNDEKTNLYFRTALESVKKADPSGLTCFHLTAGADLPDEFVKSPLLDFYILQPGHRGDKTCMAYGLIQEYYQKTEKRPIVNGEFFYEGHSYTQELYGRYNAFDQRRAMWQSVLAGAKAGIGYGAQGLWGWYRQGKEFGNEGYGGKAFPWHVALNFKGAWEGSFLKYIFDQYDLFDIEPAEIILNTHELQRKEIRAAKSADNRKIVIYMPFAEEITVAGDLSVYDFTAVDMSEKHFAKPHISCSPEKSVIRMPDFNSDGLYIGVCGKTP
ncbi:MAG: DUF4038 domain-containing protein [Treponema sp.]|jgi:hypothetical protein|nr:DUF4038 domain-containing protein [Treponema sp.]